MFFIFILIQENIILCKKDNKSLKNIEQEINNQNKMKKVISMSDDENDNNV